MRRNHSVCRMFLTFVRQYVPNNWTEISTLGAITRHNVIILFQGMERNMNNSKKILLHFLVCLICSCDQNTNKLRRDIIYCHSLSHPCITKSNWFIACFYNHYDTLYFLHPRFHLILN